MKPPLNKTYQKCRMSEQSLWTTVYIFSFSSSVKLLSQNNPNALFTSALGLFWDELSWSWVLGCDSYPGHILGSCFVTCLNGLWLFQGAPGTEEEARGCQLPRAVQRPIWQCSSLGGTARRRKGPVALARTPQTQQRRTQLRHYRWSVPGADVSHGFQHLSDLWTLGIQTLDD